MSLGQISKLKNWVIFVSNLAVISKFSLRDHKSCRFLTRRFSNFGSQTLRINNFDRLIWVPQKKIFSISVCYLKIWKSSCEKKFRRDFAIKQNYYELILLCIHETVPSNILYGTKIHVNHWTSSRRMCTTQSFRKKKQAENLRNVQILCLNIEEIHTGILCD